MLRTSGARLAVPLTLATIVIIVGLDIARSSGAQAADGCRPTSRGIVCAFTGSSISRSSATRPGHSPRTTAPLRYLAVSNGRCWYWSRHRPGFDSWDSAFDQSIILTRWRLPRCTGRSASAPVVVIDVAARAWSVFRAFPLGAPRFALTPVVGITNLPSRLHLDRPQAFTHSEQLPDGRRLQVAASVDRVWIDWGDGEPPTNAPLAQTVGRPGAVRHTFRLKTCPPGYRSGHLDGPKCHPVLERYPITVTLQWSGRYRAGGAWKGLGSIDRSGSSRYDVDEVLGVLLAGGGP